MKLSQTQFPLAKLTPNDSNFGLITLLVILVISTGIGIYLHKQVIKKVENEIY
jgi:hypothetical protein